MKPISIEAWHPISGMPVGSWRQNPLLLPVVEVQRILDAGLLPRVFGGEKGKADVFAQKWSIENLG